VFFKSLFQSFYSFIHTFFKVIIHTVDFPVQLFLRFEWQQIS